MRLFPPKSQDVIEVEFFDVKTATMLAKSKMPIAQLPKSFEASTTLHLANDDWSVVEARPMTAAEFSRTGKLVLILNKMVKGFVDPSTILFSLPTITGDALPAVKVGTSKLGAELIEIHEDDWRQVEWLPASAENVVASELMSINEILSSCRKGVGFSKCHLRENVPTLSNGELALDDFRDLIPPNARWLAGFGYRGAAGIVESSFAVRLFSSIELFGTESEGRVESICFANTRGNNAAAADVRKLAEFADRHGWILVDWCRAAVIGPSFSDYMEYFVNDR